MAAFTQSELQFLQILLRPPSSPMHRLCSALDRHTRDEVVEAIDALRRTSSIEAAQKRVNAVLTDQAAGHQLVNGTRIEFVCRNWPELRSYRPMF